MQASTPLSQMHIDDRLHYTTIVSLANTIQMYWPFVAVTCMLQVWLILVKIVWLGLQSLQPTSACGTLKMKDPQLYLFRCNVM